MAITTLPCTAVTPLLGDTVGGAVDFGGRPVYRSSSGGWNSAFFVIAVEIAGRIAYLGIEYNLISYLTGQLGQSTATAAKNVNAWAGLASLLPLVGAFVADSFLGRYRTIVFASAFYILGLGLLTVSALLTSSTNSDCHNSYKTTECSPPQFQVFFFFFSLYLVAVAQGGHKPCVQAFGADQFDRQDPEECKAKSSFFNWWYFGMCGGTSVGLLFLNYIQDNLSWGLGFGIPCIMMVVAFFIFLLGTRTYRCSVREVAENPFVRIGRVFAAAAKNWKTTSLAVTTEEEACGSLPLEGSHLFRFKPLLAPGNWMADGKVCSIRDVEDAKAVVRLVKIWATSLAYAIVLAQVPTLFTKQAKTMDRSIGSGFDIPAASLSSFISLFTVFFAPLYDRVFVPTARALTERSSGITMLQRIGAGMLLSVIAIIIAALVEMKRLKTAREYGLVDAPNATVPMSAWWLVPPYVIFGVSDVFTMIGLQEFFYDQVPNDFRSMGLSLYLSILGTGSFLSSFLISAIERITGRGGQDSWFADNRNRAHIDYFYWLLAGISALQLIAYVYFARSYTYYRGNI